MSIHDRIRKEANRQNFSKMGRISSVNSGGTYNVVLAGGQTIYNVISIALGSKFTVDQWVTLEFFGGDWVISGESAQRGGD